MQMLCKTVNKMIKVIEAPSIDWDKYKHTLFSPVLLERQLGDWACGLFLMMALHCFALDGNYKKHCKDSLKEKMRQSTFEALLALPYVQPSCVQSLQEAEPANHLNDDDNMESGWELLDLVPDQSIQAFAPKNGDNLVSSSDFADSSHPDTSIPTITKRCVTMLNNMGVDLPRSSIKCDRDTDSSESDGYLTDRGSSSLRQPSDNHRKPYANCVKKNRHLMTTIGHELLKNIVCFAAGAENGKCSTKNAPTSQPPGRFTNSSAIR
jgi:hypothetical protein